MESEKALGVSTLSLSTADRGTKGQALKSLSVLEDKSVCLQSMHCWSQANFRPSSVPVASIKCSSREMENRVQAQPSHVLGKLINSPSVIGSSANC